MKTRFYSALAVALLLCTSAWAQNYTFQVVNHPGDPGDPFTQLLGVNNSMIIAGYHNFFQNQDSFSPCPPTSLPKIIPAR
jgi:hypothetical protein